MLRLSLLILIVAFMTSCESRRAFEADEFEREIVLNSIISTDSTWNVKLSYTKSIFDDADFSLISDANVRVINQSSGQSFFLEQKSPGLYCRGVNPFEGHEYSLIVDVPNNPQVRATTYVPSVLDVSVISQAVLDQNGLETIEIDIEIEDDPGEKNYYVWEISPFTYEERLDNTEEIEIPEIHTIQPLQSVEGETSPTNERLNVSPEDTYAVTAIDDSQSDSSDKQTSLSSPSFISDSGKTGGKILNRLVVNNDILKGIVEGSSNAETNGQPIFQLTVMAVSDDLYEYLQTYENYKQTAVKNTSGSSPSDLFSNIENGLGIFGGFNVKTFNIY
ncbi:MAG: DUF4249 family protein [Saprospiraceae bacterium]|nr:DUF4249 family protein [Saprospiraceae bacterium]